MVTDNHGDPKLLEAPDSFIDVGVKGVEDRVNNVLVGQTEDYANVHGIKDSDGLKLSDKAQERQERVAVELVDILVEFIRPIRGSLESRQTISAIFDISLDSMRNRFGLPVGSKSSVDGSSLLSEEQRRFAIRRAQYICQLNDEVKLLLFKRLTEEGLLQEGRSISVDFLGMCDGLLCLRFEEVVS